MPSAIHWFRRDLRLADSPALADAADRSAGQVIPLFILDEAILRAPAIAPARVAFLLDSLRALDADLRARGSRLIVRRGQPDEVLAAVAREAGAATAHWGADYTPYALRRDQQCRAALAELGVAAHVAPEALIFEPGEVLSAARSPYTVFTPFRRTWRALVQQRLPELLGERPPAPLRPPPAGLASDPIPSAEELGVATGQPLPPGGERAGQERLASFARAGMGAYASARDMLAEAGTSRLSAHLRLGCVAPRAALRAALRQIEASGDDPQLRDSAETWVSELAWRDFYYHIMAHFPHVLRGAFRPQYDAIAWENDPALLAAWQAGQTGYPIVDAAMRQLAAEAWMHNRARMIVASFLTKDLLVDWRLGERFFMRQLVDGDHASNNGGWQWAAGTGTDAQPYFRIFNPVSQGQRFDPQGAYVRRYVPELAGVPDRHIHAPWLMSPEDQRRAGVRVGRDYPAPIVDHAAQRARALAIYRAAAGAP